MLDKSMTSLLVLFFCSFAQPCAAQQAFAPLRSLASHAAVAFSVEEAPRRPHGSTKQED